jgi:transglutaminase-like putative cysteine protease
MPEPPAGEAELRRLAEQFVRAEGYALGSLAMAATGSRRQTLEQITGLRGLDLRGPVVAAYLHEHPDGRSGAVADLAGSLALRLDRGAQRAAESARAAFKLVNADNVAQMAKEPVTAVVDISGKRWPLGH